MSKVTLKFIVVIVLLLCLLPAGAYADNSITGSFTVGGGVIIDLAVVEPTFTTLTLHWTSPQNTNNWGPGTQYDIRYSLEPITNETWGSAIQLLNPPPPLPPSSPESLLVIGLIPCTTYFFAIKAADATGTWTPLSNSPQGTTLCSGGGGGGGISGPPATSTACPLTLTVDFQGSIASASMTNDGVLCEACLAMDTSGKNSLEIDKDTKLMLADSTVPGLLQVATTSVPPPAAENAVIIGKAYECNAYAFAGDKEPQPLSVTPSAILILNYDLKQLPPGVTEGFIASYDETEGWLPIDPGPGVAEIGKAHGLLNHFSLYAVLARIPEPAPGPAKFEVSNLSVNPAQVQPNGNVNISINIANAGGQSADYSLELMIDGIAVSSRQVTVTAGGNQLVDFNIASEIPGKHRIDLGGLVGEFEVLESASYAVNWWMIGSIIGIVIVFGIWSIIGWRWYKDRKKAVPAAATSADAPAHKSDE